MKYTALNSGPPRPSKNAVITGTIGCLLLGLFAAQLIGLAFFSLTFLLVNANG